MYEFCPHALAWPLYSATIALIYAAFRGATDIEVFGADWKGEEDFDGVKAGERRSEIRWNQEAKLWGTICKWLADHNVQVRRINGIA
jgi:hypothetical protein